MQCGCTVIKLILKMFGPVINENMQNHPVVHGVDISREERYTLMDYIGVVILLF